MLRGSYYKQLLVAQEVFGKLTKSSHHSFYCDWSSKIGHFAHFLVYVYCSSHFVLIVLTVFYLPVDFIHWRPFKGPVCGSLGLWHCHILALFLICYSISKSICFLVYKVEKIIPYLTSIL